MSAKKLSLRIGKDFPSDFYTLHPLFCEIFSPPSQSDIAPYFQPIAPPSDPNLSRFTSQFSAPDGVS